MTDERSVEELAKAQGIWSDNIKIMVPYYGGFPQWHGEIRRTKISECPAYLTSHDALQPLIDGLDCGKLSRYVGKLIRMFLPQGQITGNYRPEEQCFKATPRQKAEALVRALGKWEERG